MHMRRSHSPSFVFFSFSFSPLFSRCYCVSQCEPKHVTFNQCFLQEKPAEEKTCPHFHSLRLRRNQYVRNEQRTCLKYLNAADKCSYLLETRIYLRWKEMFWWVCVELSVCLQLAIFIFFNLSVHIHRKTKQWSCRCFQLFLSSCIDCSIFVCASERFDRGFFNRVVVVCPSTIWCRERGHSASSFSIEKRESSPTSWCFPLIRRLACSHYRPQRLNRWSSLLEI